MANIAKQELESLSEVQQEIHMPRKGTRDIDSAFYMEDSPLAWYSRNIHKFDCVPMSESKVAYSPPESATFLYDSFLHQSIPVVSVLAEYKDTVQICWPEYVAVASVQSAALRIDNIEPMTFPSIWYTVQLQYFRKANFGDIILRRAGKCSELTEWSTYLPKYTCSLQQPFLYSRSYQDALPLNLNPPSKTATSVKHIFTLRNKMSQLLRMRIMDDNKQWVEIPFDAKYISGPETLPLPELWGRFSNNTQEEIDSYRCEKGGVVRYYDDILHITSENDEELGKVFTRVLSECSYPCKAMFWMCENMTASELNVHCNFTTNAGSLLDGDTPIEFSTLAYLGKEQYKFYQLSTEHEFDESLSALQSPSVDKGYQCHSFCLDPINRIDVGVNLNDVHAKLNVALKTGTSKDKYRLHILMMVTRKLSFVKDDSERFVPRLTE